MWPVLTALKRLNGSATIKEMYDIAVGEEHFTEEQQEITAKSGHVSEIELRLALARSQLKAIGAITNSARGVWTLTEKGKEVSRVQVEKEAQAWRNDPARRVKSKRDKNLDHEDVSEDDQNSWTDQLIACLLAISPEGFERLSQRLLREAGFTNVTVLGKSGDGGIDGVGVYRLSLVSFPVYFQCKRYKGTVTAGAVRDFRGAMAGRGEKGLLITTGSFTKEAQKEASRDGAPPVELIEGERLCDLLREYRLGVEVTERTEEDVTVKPEFFQQYQEPGDTLSESDDQSHDKESVAEES